MECECNAVVIQRVLVNNEFQVQVGLLLQRRLLRALLAGAQVELLEGEGEEGDEEETEGETCHRS